MPQRGSTITPRRWGLPVPLLQVIAVILLVERGYILFGMEPLYEEAYYWLWGQHPALSYFDHPPLNAWMLGLCSLVFEWTPFALRFPTLLTLAGTMWVLRLWSRRLAPDETGKWFWTALVIYLAAPLLSLFTTIAFPDHLLVFLSLAAAYAFAVFMEGFEAGLPAYRWLWLTGLSVGLGMLSKYNGALLLPAFAMYLLSSPRRRRLFLDWRLYGSALLAVAIFSPVIAWNLQHNLASLAYQLGDRVLGAGSASVASLKGFFAESVLLLSPFLFGPLLSLLVMRGTTPAAAPAIGIARAAFVVSTIAFGVVSLLTQTFPHWNIVAYTPALIVLPLFFRAGWLLALHALFGMVLLGLAVANFVVSPLALPGLGESTSLTYGWRDIGAGVEQEIAEHPPAFLAASDSQLAARLAFAMERADVVPLGGETSQFRYWFDPDARVGEDAIILGTPGEPLAPVIAARFSEHYLVGEVKVERFGRLLNVFPIFHGIGFKG